MLFIKNHLDWVIIENLLQIVRESSENTFLRFIEFGISFSLWITINTNKFLIRITKIPNLWFLSQVETSGERWISAANTCTNAKKQVSNSCWACVKDLSYKILKHRKRRTEEWILKLKQNEKDEKKKNKQDFPLEHTYLLVKSLFRSKKTYWSIAYQIM